MKIKGCKNSQKLGGCYDILLILDDLTRLHWSCAKAARILTSCYYTILSLGMETARYKVVFCLFPILLYKSNATSARGYKIKSYVK